MANLRYTRMTRSALLAATACSVLMCSCNFAPKYARPTVPTPPTYKGVPAESAGEAGVFQPAQPQDAATRGKWWEVFNDSQLNDLEEKVDVSNQNVAAAAAGFLAARALVIETRAQLYPTVGTDPSITNSRPSAAQFGGASFPISAFTSYSL